MRYTLRSHMLSSAVFVLMALCTELHIATHAAAQGINPAQYAKLDYRFIGPEGNRVISVAGIPGDPRVYYAGSASGGIFKSTDGGTHWEPIFDDQSVSSIGSLAVALSDPNVIWAGTGHHHHHGNTPPRQFSVSKIELRSISQSQDIFEKKHFWASFSYFFLGLKNQVWT